MITHGGIARRHGRRVIARRHDWRAIALAALIGTAASACGNESPTTDPKQAIADAVEAWDKAESMHYTGTVTLDASMFGGALEVSGSGSAEGEAAWGESRQSRDVFRVKLDASELSTAGGGGGPSDTEIEWRLIGDRSYQRNIEEPNRVDLDGRSYYGDQVDEDEWSVVDLKALDASAPELGARLGSTLLESLTDVTFAGKESLDGVSTRRFRARGGGDFVDSQFGGARSANEGTDLSNSNVQLWLDNDDRLVQIVFDTALDVGFDDFGTAFEGVIDDLDQAFECALDPDASTSRKTSSTTTTSLADDDEDEDSPASFMSMQITERIRLSGYGDELSVDAPPTASLVDQTESIRDQYEAAHRGPEACATDDTSAENVTQ